MRANVFPRLGNISCILAIVLVGCGFGRSDKQCKDKFKVFPNHSACRKRSSMAIPGTIDIGEALTAHNSYRSKAAQTYNALDIMTLHWDGEIAMVAQRWAEVCQIGHDGTFASFIPGRFTVGQNILSSGVKLSWDNITENWYSELRDFKYESKGNVLTKVGHFTQLVWATSYLLGCGYSVCGGTHFYVCNYAPSGNHMGTLGKPFQTSTDQTCKQTSGRLCDCGQKTCDNNGILNMSSCQCQCQKSPGACDKLKCRGLKDPAVCKNFYKKQKCTQWSNVPFECPNMCKICPYADEEYVEGSKPVTPLKGTGSTAYHLNFRDLLPMTFTLLHLSYP